MFDSGDQKVIGQMVGSASSRTANRVFCLLSLGIVLLGIVCLFKAEGFVGAFMLSVGIVATFLFSRGEFSERAMLRRMRRRGKQPPQ